MYNEELKRRFISETVTSLSDKRVAETLFERIERFERGWDADICTRNDEELEPIAKLTRGLRSDGLRIRLDVLEDYARWCLEQEVPGACDCILHLASVREQYLKDHMIANPRYLQRYLDEIFEKEETNTIDCVYRFFYWFAFAGMQEKDTVEVLDSDVHFEDMSIRYNEIDYPIYRESLPALKKCLNLTQFRYVHPNYTIERDVYKHRTGGHILLRGMSTQTATKSLRNSIRIKSDKASPDKDLSYQRIWLSGIFYRAYEDEIAGYPPDFMDIASLYMKKKDYATVGVRNRAMTRQKQVAHGYLKDYECWKKIFYTI